MAGEIKAIETRYKGYRFRSRLEARWAVFFDALGIKWEYEKQTYELMDGRGYLPDFYLSSSDMWIEVKPSAINDPNHLPPSSANVAFAFGAWVCVGRPWVESAPVWDPRPDYTVWSPGDLYTTSSPFLWTQCARCGWFGLESRGEITARYKDDLSRYGAWHGCSNRQCTSEHTGRLLSAALQSAYAAARAARFEHGEEG
jgi:hypothetical protein